MTHEQKRIVDLLQLFHDRFKEALLHEAQCASGDLVNRAKYNGRGHAYSEAVMELIPFLPERFQSEAK